MAATLESFSGCPGKCQQSGECIRSFPCCTDRYGFHAQHAELCRHSVGCGQLHWTCCGQVEHRGPVVSALPPYLQPLFTGHCMDFTPTTRSPGNGLKGTQGGRMCAQRQDLFFHLKWRLLQQMLPALTDKLAAATKLGIPYYMTGTSSMNYHLIRRGCPAIPTDDIDVKFAPAAVPVLEYITSAWLPAVGRVLHDAADALAGAGLEVVSIVNQVCVHITVTLMQECVHFGKKCVMCKPVKCVGADSGVDMRPCNATWALTAVVGLGGAKPKTSLLTGATCVPHTTGGGGSLRSSFTARCPPQF